MRSDDENYWVEPMREALESILAAKGKVEALVAAEKANGDQNEWSEGWEIALGNIAREIRECS